jgi:hypothetical protein
VDIKKIIYRQTRAELARPSDLSGYQHTAGAIENIKTVVTAPTEL